MVYSYVYYTSDGNITEYQVTFDYLSKEFVKVYLDGVLKEIETDYIFSGDRTIVFLSVPPNGSTIFIQRVTSKDRLVEFRDASILIALDLDVSALQAIHIAEEANDNVSNSITANELSLFDALGRRIINVGDPVDPTDAVNKGYTDGIITTVDNAVTTTTNKAIEAEGYADAAALSASVAQAAATNAANDTATLLSGYVTDAQNAKDGAELAEDGAKAAATNAASDVSAMLSGYVAYAQNAKDGAELAEDGAQAAQLAAEAISTEAAARAYNYIINGNFDIWQRGTSQTIPGFGSDDRWYNGNEGSTKTHSRQSFSAGELFPDGTPCPAAYSRTVVSSIVGANNYTLKAQKIEDVRRLAGKKVVLSFYAKANTFKSMAIDVVQLFGDDGNPSAAVAGIGSQKINLTAIWKRFVVNIELPSIVGKVLGTRGNSNTTIHFWFDAGTNSNARTKSLGHQSGTFDIACVSLVEGDVDVKPIPRSIGEELALCQRYYARGGVYTRSYATGAGHVFNSTIYFPCMMRAVPVTTLTDGGGRLNVQSVLLASAPWPDSTRHEITSAGVGDCRALGDVWTADAEL